MLTSAPVSTRYVRLLVRSVTCNRRQVDRPATPVAASDWPWCLNALIWYRVVCICGLTHQTSGDTSTVL